MRRTVFGIYSLLASFGDAQVVPPSHCTLVTPTPANQVCGVIGEKPLIYNRKHPFPIKQLVTSFSECRDLCLRRDSNGYGGCSSFWLNSTSSICFLNEYPILSLTEDSSSNVTFYNHACYKCPSPCSQPTGVNVLDNGGFELSPRFFTPWWTDDGARISQDGSNSSQAYSYTGIHNTQTLIQTFKTCNTTLYEWGFDYRAGPKGPDSIHVYSEFEYQTGINLEIVIPRQSTARNWSTYTDLVVLNTASNEIDFSTAADHRVALLDNIRIVPSAYTFDTAADAINIVPNGGFETGSVSPWITNPAFYENCTIKTPGINSAHAYRCDWEPNYPNLITLELLQNYTDNGPITVPGTPYLLSFDYASSVPDLILQLFFYLDTQIPGNTKQFHTLNSIHRTDNKFFQGQTGTAKVPFVGQQDIYYLTLYFDIRGSTDHGGYFIIDNISIKELAPPQSTA